MADLREGLVAGSQSNHEDVPFLIVLGDLVRPWTPVLNLSHPRTGPSVIQGVFTPGFQARYAAAGHGLLDRIPGEPIGGDLQTVGRSLIVKPAQADGVLDFSFVFESPFGELGE